MTSEHRAAAAFLICRSEKWLCALPLENVAETMRPLPIEPLADLPPSILGIAVIRSAMVPVVDVAMLVDGASASTSPTRFVSLRLGANRQVALALGEVVGVRTLGTEALKDIPALLSDTAPHIISAIAQLDAEFLLVLQAARMVPESLWRDLDAKVPQA